jgi:hypothetical protein
MPVICPRLEWAAGLNRRGTPIDTLGRRRDPVVQLGCPRRLSISHEECWRSRPAVTLRMN